MQTFVIVIHIIVALFLILVVLLQTGKGASMGAVFGSGSQTMFGGSNASNLLTKLTGAAAIIFMVTSLSLSIFSVESGQDSVIPEIEEKTTAPLDSTSDSSKTSSKEEDSSKETTSN